MKSKIKFGFLAVLLCTAFTAAVHAQLPNAWQINDDSGSAFLSYQTDLPAPTLQVATNGGWSFAVNARFVGDAGSGSQTMLMIFGDGVRRWEILWSLNANGDLVAELYGDGNKTYTVTTGGTGTNAYLTHQMVYDASSQTASYLVDGQVVASNWTGGTTAWPAGRVAWGSGSSGGIGTMNFHSVGFVAANNVVASYVAGTEGNPAIAPNPNTVFGWTLSSDPPPAGITVTNISPDSGLLPVAVTLAADNITASGARLNGEINPNGLPTTAWFAWGTDTNYGNITGPQNMRQGILNSNLSATLSGLVAGQTYHYRVVASNELGSVTGNDAAILYAPLAPVSYWRMGDDDPGVTAGPATSTTDPIGGRTMILQGSPHYDTNVALEAVAHTASAWSMQFVTGQYGTSTLIASLTNNFGIELWVNPSDTSGTHCLAYNGNSSTSGWGLYLINGEYRGLFGGVQEIGSGTATTATAGTWTHLALVRDNGTATLYVNGVAAGSTTSPPNLPTGQFAAAAQPQNPALEQFAGRLDEVRVFTFAPGNFSADELLLNAYPFLETPVPGLPGVSFSSVAWGDYDDDGRLDFLISGTTISNGIVSQLWRNTGNGFTDVRVPGLAGVYYGSMAWDDYDNDGRLDFLITGQNAGSKISQLWRNTGSGFTSVPVADLPPIESGSVAWGDYNNDGRPDLLITGDSFNYVSQLLRNTGNGLTNVPIPGLQGVNFGSVAWGDYDNDGRLDFLLTGITSGGTRLSQLWRNTGSGFTNVPIPGLPGVAAGSVAWGDYDNDGRLDFLITGYGYNGSSYTAISQLWRNTGSGFTNVPIPGLPGVDYSSVAWGDYDNDGRLDFLISGETTNGTPIIQLWRNTGTGFTNVPLPGLSGVYGRAAWGDYDNDGRLDFLLTGYIGSYAYVSKLWRNNVPVTNAPPAAPTGLSTTVFGGTVTLHWNAAADDHTPAAGLNYNVRVGTAPGGADVLSPMALTNGVRLLPALGNAQMRTNLFLLGLNPGTTYYWSVQAVDTAFAGGPFATEASFVMPGPTLSIVSSNSDAIISWQPSYAGVVLQESSSLNPAAWTNSPSGATNPVAVPARNATMFYRLFKP